MLGHKQPGEVYPFTYDFRDQLGDGDSINAIVDAISVPRGAGANMVEATRAEAGGLVTIYWEGGADGESYLTTVKVTSANAAEYELSGEILVQARTFQVPDLQTTYLSADEYVARYGREETVRITDESRLSQIDEAKLAAALADATEYAEGYLRGRYDLPLASPPSNIKGIVAALAREQLFRTRPTQQVTDNADRARALLKEIALGRVVLALETGEELESAGGGLAIWGGSDPPTFNPEKMDRFADGLGSPGE